MATALARGAAQRGKRIAFGDRSRIVWGPFSAEVFRANPNIAPRGSEREPDIEWIEHYKGHRLYHQGIGVQNNRWIWNFSYRVQPGEFFNLPTIERQKDFILIEPNVAANKHSSPNRMWPADRFQQVADRLIALGYRLVQTVYDRAARRLRGVEHVNATFREALELLQRAQLFIGSHGGLTHAAAAVGTPAVVLFGGWAPPQVLGYSTHANIGTDDACGAVLPCEHCAKAMNAITVEQVMDATKRLLDASPVKV